MAKSKHDQLPVAQKQTMQRLFKWFYDEKALCPQREILLYYFDDIDPLSINQLIERESIIRMKRAQLSTMVRAGAYAGRKGGRSGETSCYILAEDYHQDYLKNPSGYCLSMEADAENHWLTQPTIKTWGVEGKLNWRVLPCYAKEAAEAHLANTYDQTFEEGIYVDITTGEPLFFA